MGKLGLTITDIDTNPVLTSTRTEDIVSLYQTRESLFNPQTYTNFLKNAISRLFRPSIFYTRYKQQLIEYGLDRDALQSNLSCEICTIEMHHSFLTIFDIAMIICEHTLNTEGQICTFDLVQKLKEEHSNNNIPIVMLTKTNHDVYHDTNELFLTTDVTFGNWERLIRKYNQGITPGIAEKIERYIETSLENGGKSNTNDLLKLRNEIYNWSLY